MTRGVTMTLAMLAGAVPSAWAAATTTPSAPAAGGGSGAAVAVALVVGLLVVVGVVVKLFDLRRRREAEAVHLQAQISDALLRDPALFGLPITPHVHIPLWSGTPATLTVTGEVSTDALRESVIRLVQQEASRVRADVRVDDRLSLATDAARVA